MKRFAPRHAGLCVSILSLGFATACGVHVSRSENDTDSADTTDNNSLVLHTSGMSTADVNSSRVDCQKAVADQVVLLTFADAAAGSGLQFQLKLTGKFGGDSDDNSGEFFDVKLVTSSPNIFTGTGKIGNWPATDAVTLTSDNDFGVAGTIQVTVPATGTQAQPELIQGSFVCNRFN